MFTLIVALIFGLALGELASIAAFILRYRMPPARGWVKSFQACGHLVSAIALLLLAEAALLGEEQALGMDILTFFLIYFGAQFFIKWVFIAYVGVDLLRGGQGRQNN